MLLSVTSWTGFYCLLLSCAHYDVVVMSYDVMVCGD